MKVRLSCVAIFAILVFASPALAQEEDIFDEDDTADKGKKDSQDSNSLADIYDDPDRIIGAVTVDSKAMSKEVKFVRYTKATYPSQLLLRPLVIPEQMVEASLEVPMVLTGDATALAQVVRGRYGITSDIQIGLTYGVAFEGLSPSGFEAGKAFSIDATYLIIPRLLAVSLRVPFYANPFAMGLILGAPLRLVLNDKIALFLGEDLVHISVSRFSPIPENPGQNLATLAAIDGGTDNHPGNLNFSVRALYQIKAGLAAWGSIGYLLVPFATDKPALPIFVGISWTKGALDVGARVGIHGIDPDNSNLGLSLFAAYRI